MDAAEAILAAMQEEADNMGCSGVEPYSTLSDLLSRLVVRANQLMGDTGHD